MSAEEEVGQEWLHCKEVVLPLTPPYHMTFSMVCSSAGIIGNSLALWLLGRRNSGGLSVFRVLLVYLAAADLTGILSTTPVVVTSYLTSNPMQGLACQWHAFVMVLSGLVTPLTVCILASERFSGVCFPLLHARLVTLNSVRSLVAGLWTSAAIFSLLPCLGFGRYALQYPCTWCFIDIPAWSEARKQGAYSGNSTGRAGNYALHNVYASAFSLLHLILIGVILALNGAVQADSRWRSAGPGDPGLDHASSLGCTGLPNGRSISLEERTICVVTSVSVVHIVCWLPLSLRVVAHSDDQFSQPQMLDLIAVRLASLNQVLNPWVYIICHRICSRPR